MWSSKAFMWFMYCSLRQYVKQFNKLCLIPNCKWIFRLYVRTIMKSYVKQSESIDDLFQWLTWSRTWNSFIRISEILRVFQHKINFIINACVCWMNCTCTCDLQKNTFLYFNCAHALKRFTEVCIFTCIQ